MHILHTVVSSSAHICSPRTQDFVTQLPHTLFVREGLPSNQINVNKVHSQQYVYDTYQTQITSTSTGGISRSGRGGGRRITL